MEIIKNIYKIWQTAFGRNFMKFKAWEIVFSTSCGQKPTKTKKSIQTTAQIKRISTQKNQKEK